MAACIFFLFLTIISGVSGRGFDCVWVTSLDCSTYKSEPECGSDGVTYNNRCSFAKAQCTKSNLNILNMGRCPDSLSTNDPRVTSTTMPPGPSTTRQPLFLGHNAVQDFFCRELSHQACPDDTEKVCGKDGNTYPNYCEFEKQRCTHHHLEVTHFGPCA